MRRLFILLYMFFLIGCGGTSNTNVSAYNVKKLDVNTSWYWQLQGNLKKYSTKLYDIDLFDTSKDTINKLKKEGKIVICYFSAGTYENWREDANQFKEEDLGNEVDGWEGERWLDIRSENVRDIMKKRLDLAKNKGCDGVEPDNVDGYINNTGFDLTYDDQIDYNIFLSKEAKKRGLLVGLKNDLDQIPDLVDYFDFALNEECHEFNECDKLMPFIRKNKPVFNAEYDSNYLSSENFHKLCEDANKRKFMTAIYSKDLDGSLFKPCYKVKK